MREEPLFNDDILISIYRHFNFFFTWSGLIVYAAIVLAVLFLNWLLVRFLFKREKLSLLPDVAAIQKQEELESAVDALRGRFGPFSVRRGLLLTDRQLSGINPKDDHIIHPESFFKRS